MEILNLVSPHATVAGLRNVYEDRHAGRERSGTQGRAAAGRQAGRQGHALLASCQPLGCGAQPATLLTTPPAAVHIVMELCVGGELFERIISKGTFSEAEAARHFRRMVEMVRGSVGWVCLIGTGVCAF